uniref:Uncharacterized protein n=1 Tax=Palpitomonas bilix TaxID=652834 RepID=A0A7S3DI23_9EUKA
MDACFSSSASAFTSSSFPPHTCEFPRGQREQTKKGEDTQGGAAQSVMCMFTQVPPFVYLTLAHACTRRFKTKQGREKLGGEKKEKETVHERSTLQLWHHCQFI